MGGKPSKKLVPNRPVPNRPAPNRPLPKLPGPAPTRMVPKSQVKMVPPDGGWGWMVVFGACLSLTFFPAVTVAFGVLFSDRLQEMGAGATAFTVIGNSLSTVWSFVALLAAPLSELFGPRRVTILGSSLAFLAMILSAYSTNLFSFGLSYAVVGGIAGTLSTFNGFTIIPLYFSKRKGFANGVVAASSALGKIAMAPLVRYLLDEYGYEWACLIVAALSLHGCISGMLYQPPEWHRVPEKKSLPPDSEMLDINPTSPRPLQSSSNSPSQGIAAGISSLRNGESSGTFRSNSIREEDEDDDDEVIFVMPMPETPTMTHKTPTDSYQTPTSVHKTPTNAYRTDDEASLVSRRNNSRISLRFNREDSVESKVESWTGSLDMMPPIDAKVFDDEDNDETKSCCDDFIVVKVFRMLNYSLVKDPKFHLVAWPNALSIMTYLNAMYALPGYIRSLGYTPYQSAFAISVFSATEVVFRLMVAALSDLSWFPTEHAYIFGIILSSISLTAMTFIPTYEWILTWVAIYGVALSIVSVLLIHIMIKHLGQENYAQVIGFCSILNGVCLITGGFFIGLAHDYFDNFESIFYIMSTFSSIGAVIWITWLGYGAVRSRYNVVSVQAE